MSVANQNSIERNSTDSSKPLTTDDIKRMWGIPEWVDNDLVEKIAVETFLKSLKKEEDVPKLD